MITYRKAKIEDESLIHSWLEKPHIAKWWDEHTNHPDGGLTRKDLALFLNKSPSVFTHWIASFKEEPYAYIMTSYLDPDAMYAPFMKNEKDCWTLDFFIGNEKYLGKGLSTLTIKEFALTIPKDVSALFVDPHAENHKALHMYEKIGFIKVHEWTPTEGIFAGRPQCLMKWKL